MALCALLAFWTGGDGQRIDRLFRQSGLMREKWDERHYADGSTYGEVTIERVLASADEFYDPDQAAEPRTDESVDRTEPVQDDDAVLQQIQEEQDALHLKSTDTLAIMTELQIEVEKLDAANERLLAERQRLEEQNEDLHESLSETEAKLSAFNASLLTRLRRLISGFESDS